MIYLIINKNENYFQKFNQSSKWLLINSQID